MNSPWPDSFDFEKDETCKKIFRPFIEEEMQKLRDYDRKRPKDITYIFHQHAKRVANDVKRTCLYLGLGDAAANNMYWAALPHDIGKRKLPIELWDQQEKPSGEMKHLRRTHTDLGAEIVHKRLPGTQHPFKDLMLDIMRNHHEQMDGGGYRGLRADQISLPVRLVAIVEAFDGWRIPRPHFGDRDISVQAVLTRMREEKSGFFDRDLFEAFAAMKKEE